MQEIRTSKLFILSTFLYASIFLLVASHTLRAEINGRILVTSISSVKVSILLQLNTSSAPDAMGGATMVIGFDSTVLQYNPLPIKNVDYIFHNFCEGNYSPATVTRPITNNIWINIDLPFVYNYQGTLVAGGNNWTDVVTINFDLVYNEGLTNIYWIPNSMYWGIYDDDNYTLWNNGQFQDALNIPLPVELSSFAAKVTNENIQLNWTTETEVNNFGFNIERKANQDEWRKIGFVTGYGNSNSPKSYVFVDNNLTGGSHFFYRLKQLDTDGSFEYSEIVEVEYVPQIFKLYQNYPNPFNPSTKIKYSIPQSSNVIIKIFDILGNEIETLVNEEEPVGTYELVFDATELSSGIYFYKLQAGDYIATMKMIVIK